VEPLRQAAENLASVSTQTLFRQIDASPKSPVLLPPQDDRWSGVYTGQYVSLVYSLSNYYGSTVYGAVEVQQPLELLTRRLSLDSNSGMTVFLLDGEGRQLWPTGQEYTEYVDTQYTTVLRILPQYDWSLALTQSRESVLRPFISVFWLLLIGGVFLLLTMALVVYLISRRISAPLVSFSRQVSAASLANLPDNWDMEGNIDEIRDLGMAFSLLMERLSTAVDLEKKAYLQALQSQMNPHFLYNTLSMLSAMGMEAGNDAITYACERLSNLMRYVTDSSFSTLDKEIGSIRDYLEIMKLRYEDHFSYNIVTEGDLCVVTMPRLILQPLTENCFEHAFKEVPPPWRIDIFAKGSPTEWEVSIADNGCGLEEARLAELERNVALYASDLPKKYRDMHAGGLGLLNTIVRLKLLGGISYEIKRLAPTGTVITLKGRTVNGVLREGG
jgi:sensor histidine kinase YesM